MPATGGHAASGKMNSRNEARGVERGQTNHLFKSDDVKFTTA
ncbi:MAG: hypothetical protein U0X92_09965 [Anaerolineales bacterium]